MYNFLPEADEEENELQHQRVGAVTVDVNCKCFGTDRDVVTCITAAVGRDSPLS